MKIKINKGKQFDGDRLFTIETTKDEAFSLYKFLILTNQLAFNESKKYERALKSGNSLWFEDSTKFVIELAKKGIDLLDEENEEYLNEICRKWKLKMEKFEQTKIRDFVK